MNEKKLDSITLPQLDENEKMGINAKKMLQVMDPYDFEGFIYEWLKYCKYKGKSISIYNIGGTGDHGIDIDVYYQGKEHVYQCKRYLKALNPSMIKRIIIKVLWYFFKDYSGSKYPEMLGITALNDFTSSGVQLFEKKDKLKNECINYIKTALESEEIVYTDDEFFKFQSYVNLYDFNTTYQFCIDDIIKEYHNSEIGFFRFASVTPNFSRPKDIDLSALPQLYIDEISAVLDKTLMPSKEKEEYIMMAKNDFYSAISLKELCYYFFGNVKEYEKIEDDIYELMKQLNFNIYSNDFVRMQTILNEVKSLDLSNSFLQYSMHIVNYSDRKGTCHGLVNNGKFKWEK